MPASCLPSAWAMPPRSRGTLPSAVIEEVPPQDLLLARAPEFPPQLRSLPFHGTRRPVSPSLIFLEFQNSLVISGNQLVHIQLSHKHFNSVNPQWNSWSCSPCPVVIPRGPHPRLRHLHLCRGPSRRSRVSHITWASAPGTRCAEDLGTSLDSISRVRCHLPPSLAGSSATACRRSPQGARAFLLNVTCVLHPASVTRCPSQDETTPRSPSLSAPASPTLNAGRSYCPHALSPAAPGVWPSCHHCPLCVPSSEPLLLPGLTG